MVLEPTLLAQSLSMDSSGSTMASSSSTMATSSTSSISSTNVMNQPLLSNMANMMTVKLDNTNYIVWKQQISMVLETYSLFELLEEPQLIPKKVLKDLSGVTTTILNPNYFL